MAVEWNRTAIGQEFATGISKWRNDGSEATLATRVPDLLS